MIDILSQSRTVRWLGLFSIVLIVAGVLPADLDRQ